jgi:nicotinic acetylcholine receptor
LFLGSWTYDGDSIDIQFYDNRTEISRDEYITSNEWDIIEAPAVRNEKFYSCCKEPYPDL